MKTTHKLPGRPLQQAATEWGVTYATVREWYEADRLDAHEYVYDGGRAFLLLVEGDRPARKIGRRGAP